MQGKAAVAAHLLPDARAHVHDLPPRLHLFLDYDGVLAPIVEDPSQAWPDPRALRALAKLRHACPVTVVTGRDGADAAARIGLPWVEVVGGHGLDEAPDARWQPALQRVHARLQALLEADAVPEGVLIERKRHSLACHYRRAPRHADRVAEAVRAATDGEDTVRILQGHMVYEVRPDTAIDKGSVVARRAGSGRHPVYVGDDTTDEDAFCVLRDGGTGIIVADDHRATLARFRLAAQADVAPWLEELGRRFVP